MLVNEHEDSKLEISILQLRAINNEDRQKGVWLKNIRRHAEQDNEYHFLKEVRFLDHKNTTRIMQIIQYWQVYHHLTLNKEFYIFMGVPDNTSKDV